MTADAGQAYARLTTAEAPRRWWRTCAPRGCCAASEPYTHTVPFSHRSGARVEPLISLQWFCDMSRLAEPAIAAVEQGRVRFTPAKWGEVYLNWMREIRPWCISRQLWWGHQIPVWYRGDEVYVGLDRPRGRGLGARRRRARHVVQLGAVAVRHARLARADARARAVLPDAGALDRARHHLPVGRPDGDDGRGVHRRRALHRRLHPLGGAGARRPAHEQVARHRHRPASS